MSAAKKVEEAVKKTAAKVVKKAKTVVKKAVKKAKTVVKKAKKTASKIKKKVCTTAKRIQKATVSFVKNVDWKKVVAGTVAAVAIAGAVALTGGAAMPVLIGAAQAGGMGALVSGAAAAAQGGSIADIAKAASDGFLWGAIGGAIAGGTAVMFNQAATTGSSLAGNYAVRQAVDVGTDTVLDTVQAVARGEDVNAKTIGRDLLANTLMAGAQAAGGSGKNGIVDGSGKINTASYKSASSPYDLQPTHSQTLSKKEMNKLVADVSNNGIIETIKYVEHNGTKYVVDGHHRLIAAKRLGLTEMPTEKVELPYAGYKTIEDLLWFD